MDRAEAEKLYKALVSKDPRYDGRFYFGVKTTGVYCRPICFARPKKENVRFYRSKAEAERAGYRPCLRCRPDLSPVSSQWTGTAAVVSRALGLISEGQADGNTVSFLADKLGMSDRHLRRLFEEHLGASPIDVAISRRLHVARLLLSQTGMSITDVAMSSGFSSLRRFNDAFLKTYRRSPREFRKEAREDSTAAELGLQLRIPYVAPYDWDHLLRYFRNHEVFGVEAVEHGVYFRHARMGDGYCQFQARNDRKTQELVLSVKIDDFKSIRPLIAKIRHVFDIDHNPHQIEVPGDCPRALSAIFEENRGIRVPGAFEPYETAIAIILGQLVSVEQGRRNVRKLVEAYGEPIAKPNHPRLTRFFPSPSVLARQDLSSIGIPRMRAGAIRELSRRYLDGTLNLSCSSDLESTKKSLLAIQGIGPWTVEMIALRCLRDTDAYPARDLVLSRAAGRHGFDASHFAPWRAYAALCLWKTLGANST